MNMSSMVRRKSPKASARARSRGQRRFSPDEQRRIVRQGGKLGVRQVCQEYGIAHSTFYRWQKQLRFQLPKHHEIKLHALRRENSKLRNKVAELWLDYTSLRAALINVSEREC